MRRDLRPSAGVTAVDRALPGVRRAFTRRCNHLRVSEHQVLGPATAGWSDYVGTAAAEDAVATLGSPSLYELAGVDRERWTILGIDIAVDGTTAVTVYAFDRLAHGLVSIDDIERLGWESGQIPVTAFPVGGTQVEAFVEDAFKRLSVRLVARPVRDQALVVTD